MENKTFAFLLAILSLSMYLLMGVLEVEENTRGSDNLFQASIEAQLFEATDEELGHKSSQ